MAYALCTSPPKANVRVVLFSSPPSAPAKSFGTAAMCRKELCALMMVQRVFELRFAFGRSVRAERDSLR